MIRIFIGFDHRQAVSYQVLHHSIMRRSSVPVSITPLFLPQLPITRQGLTPFTYSRYLVPWLCEYQHMGVFFDSDMLCLADMAWIDGVMGRVWSEGCSVGVRQFEGEKQFERPSLMIFNNARCTDLTPERIEDPNYHPQAFEWARDGVWGIDPEWNRLVGYENCDDAKILHYTAGVPIFPQTENLGHAEPWHEEHKLMNGIAPWEALMGNSVHIENLGIGNGRATSVA